MIYAHCYRSGEITFSRKKDEPGRVMLGGAKGPHAEWVRRVAARARLAYDNKTLLVPGLPEAESDDEAAQAVERFRRFLSQP